MQTLKLDSGYTIRYYGSLDEFPAERRAWLVRYSIEASEMPSTMEGLADLLKRAMEAYNEGRNRDGHTYLQNFYLAVEAVKSLYTPEAYEFCCLIHDVDGERLDDMTPEGLAPIARKLAIPVGQMRQLMEDVKKNSISSVTSISLGLPPSQR